MTRFLIISLIFLSINAPIYSQSTSIENFWTEFKSAVISNDTIKLVSMVDFSKDNGIIGNNSAEFLKNYNSIFDDKTIEMLTNTKKLTKSENNEYRFVGSNAYKIFKFKKIKGKYKLNFVSYYD